MDTASIAIVIAVYGALLSTFLLGWTIFRDLTDKGKLSVHCYIGNIIARGGPKDANDYLIYSVTNTGRKPIMVTHLGGKTKEGLFFIPSEKLPKMLNPDEYLVEYTPDLSILNNDLVALWACPSVGKYFNVQKKILRQVIEEGKKKSKAGQEKK